LGYWVCLSSKSRADDRIITYQMLSTAIPWRFGVTCDEHMMEICTPKIVFQERYWGRKSIGGEYFPERYWVELIGSHGLYHWITSRGSCYQDVGG
jgi:hypothetical protein